MALVMLDRVQETTNTTGTGTLTLAGATSGCQTFSNIGDGNTTYYTIYSSPDWEVGIGTYTSAGNTLSRDTVLASSLGGTTKINVAAGAFVFGTYPAGRAVYADATNAVSGYTISSCTINGTPIGQSTAAAITGTSIIATAGTTGSSNVGAFSYGTMGYSDQNTLASFVSSVNNYNQVVIQNTSSGTNASANITINNNLGTASTYYMNLGMNSSGWTGSLGTASLNAPSVSYLTSTSSDLAIGTTTSNAIRFVINGGADAMVIDTSSRVGIGVAAPTYKLDIQNAGTFTGINIQNTTTSGLTNLFIQNTVNTLTYGVSPGGSYMSYTGTGPLSFSAGGSDLFTFAQTGELGIGITPDGSSTLQIKAGSATECPLELTAGTLMTTPDAGSYEYDGVVAYFTNDDASLRGIIPSTQLFRLTANGTAFGPAIGNFFGANSAINLAGGGIYEIEAVCRFTKTTAGTVTVTATTSLAPVNLSGVIQTGAVGGGSAVGAANQIALYNSTATASAFGATASLTTATNHTMIIKLLVEANASASNLRINFTCGAGTVTPLRTSYYKVTRLSAGNTGSFAA